MNNLKYSKKSKDFYIQPENFDNLNDYMSSIYFLEVSEGNSNKIMVKPLKSDWIEEEFLLYYKTNLMSIN